MLPDLRLDAAVTGAEAGFQLRDLPGTTPAAVVDSIHRWLGTPDETGFLLTDGRRLVQLTEPADAVRAAIPAEAPSAWRGLDVVLAHHGLLAHLLHRGDDPASVLVAHSVEEAVRTAAERSGVALLRARAVAGRGGRRPPGPGHACPGSRRCSFPSPGPDWYSGHSRTEPVATSPRRIGSRRPLAGRGRGARDLATPAAVHLADRRRPGARTPEAALQRALDLDHVAGCHSAARRCSDRS